MNTQQQSPAEYVKDARRIQAVATTLEQSLQANPKQQTTLNVKTEAVREKLRHNSQFQLSQFVIDLEQYIEWCEANQQQIETAIQETSSQSQTSHGG